MVTTEHNRLLHDQLNGVAAWRRLRERERAACASQRLTREQRLDASRRLDALQRQEAALRDQSERVQAWHASGGRTATRTIIAHHEPWLRAKLASLLADAGQEVRALPLDGAACIGACAAEQPDVLLVSDPVTMLTAVETVRACREVSPATWIVVHCDVPEDAGRLADAGADAVYSRQLSPSGLVAELAVTRSTA